MYDYTDLTLILSILIVLNQSSDYYISQRVGGNRKCYQQSTYADQKSIETVFSIVSNDF